LWGLHAYIGGEPAPSLTTLMADVHVGTGVSRGHAGPREVGAQMADAAAPVLQTRGVSKDFRGFRAVDDVDVSVQAGTVHALVGPNGAGKTTLFNLLTGFLRPSAGVVLFEGRAITGWPPERIARLGIARSFQITSLFEQLSVREHVELALQAQTRLGLRFWRSDRLLDRFRDEAMGLLDEVGLGGRAEAPAGSLAYGQKRALELALALALRPKLLLLDEPTAGMGVEDVARTVQLIRRIKHGRTVVMVEHNMTVVADLADRVTVLQFGSVLVEGPYDEVRRDPRVITAYLGESVA
jgi:branched-chain amino acid transport system ATP-binding protein